MPCRILREWAEYAAVEPFGDGRADIRAAIIASTVANCAPRSKKGRRKPFKIEDFMPKFRAGKSERRGDTPQLTPDQLFAKLQFMTMALGGKVVDKRQKTREDK